MNYDKLITCIQDNGFDIRDGNIINRSTGEQLIGVTEDCWKLNELTKQIEQLKDELDSANNEIEYCHMIIETLVADAGVGDYNDLLNNCDKDILKEMGWKFKGDVE